MKKTKTLKETIRDKPADYPDRETIKKEMLGIHKKCGTPNPTGQEEVKMERFITVLHGTVKALLKKP